MAVWNPWHGCHKLSEGCRNCYVYRMDMAHSKQDSHIVKKNAVFDLPVRRKRNGEYKLSLAAGEPLYTCMTSDFFLEDADEWRDEVWDMIRQRQDIHFIIITKRIHRFAECIPHDWGDGWDNVTICCTCENAPTAEYRLPIFASLKIRHKEIVCEPLLSEIDLSGYLGSVERVTAGGESGNEARLCRYEWILDIRRQCVESGTSFYFKQTGAYFEKDGRYYRIKRALQHSQARRAGINIEF